MLRILFNSLQSVKDCSKISFKDKGKHCNILILVLHLKPMLFMEIQIQAMQELLEKYDWINSKCSKKVHRSSLLNQMVVALTVMRYRYSWWSMQQNWHSNSCDEKVNSLWAESVLPNMDDIVRVIWRQICWALSSVPWSFSWDNHKVLVIANE